MYKLFSIIVLISLCAYGYGAHQDYSWTVSLTVSDVPGSEYEGEIEILAVFKDQTQHSTVLPWTRYQVGQTYFFQVRLTSPGAIQSLYIRTKGFCPLGLLPVDLLRLRKIEMLSKSTNTAYTKQVDDLAIKDACQSTSSQGTALTGFSESNASFCVIVGQKYENGERFDLGCSGRCKCENGSVACVDMCPAVSWGPDQKCHFVHVPGQCCDRVVCENDQTTKSCEEPRPGLKTADNKLATPVRRYPWSVLYCTDVNCTQIHGGVIVGEKHILTYAPDLTGTTSLLLASEKYIVGPGNMSDFDHLHISNVTTHPDFVNENSPIADSASRLQVVELQESFAFNKELQAANFPFDKAHCLDLSKSNCPVMAVGWDRTDDSDDEIRQWFLHADKSKHDESLCQSNSTDSRNPKIAPRRRGDKRICVGGMVRQDCTGPLAGAAVASAASADFVVGLMDPDAALFFCDHPGSADVLPLCKYLDWINQVAKLNY